MNNNSKVYTRKAIETVQKMWSCFPSDECQSAAVMLHQLLADCDRKDALLQKAKFVIDLAPCTITDGKEHDAVGVSIEIEEELKL
jgi:hypothetical protein